MNGLPGTSTWSRPIEARFSARYALEAHAHSVPVFLENAVPPDVLQTLRWLAAREDRPRVAIRRSRDAAAKVIEDMGCPAPDANLSGLKVPAMLDLMFEELGEIGYGQRMLRGILVHLWFVWVHPVPDGKGRTARLLMNTPFFGGGLPWLTIRVEQRDECFATLRSALLNTDPHPHRPGCTLREGSGKAVACHVPSEGSPSCRRPLFGRASGRPRRGPARALRASADPHAGVPHALDDPRGFPRADPAPRRWPAERRRALAGRGGPEVLSDGRTPAVRDSAGACAPRSRPAT
ncbi:MAG: hypothetical protein FIA95_06880 [Gemmatimonadetes bacterium]|nr:hypothetical protein [Gemmatimonadota bacterium]